MMNKKDKKARELINEVLMLYGKNEKFLDREVFFNQVHKKLKKEEINNAVVIFVVALGLTGGSVGDIDLYKLLQKYLLDLKFRKKVNKIIDVGFYWNLSKTNYLSFFREENRMEQKLNAI